VESVTQRRTQEHEPFSAIIETANLESKANIAQMPTSHSPLDERSALQSFGSDLRRIRRHIPERNLSAKLFQGITKRLRGRYRLSIFALKLRQLLECGKAAPLPFRPARVIG
jgi:hypothetical protein